MRSWHFEGSEKRTELNEQNVSPAGLAAQARQIRAIVKASLYCLTPLPFGAASSGNASLSHDTACPAVTGQRARLGCRNDINVRRLQR